MLLKSQTKTYWWGCLTIKTQIIQDLQRKLLLVPRWRKDRQENRKRTGKQWKTAKEQVKSKNLKCYWVQWSIKSCRNIFVWVQTLNWAKTVGSGEQTICMKYWCEFCILLVNTAGALMSKHVLLFNLPLISTLKSIYFSFKYFLTFYYVSLFSSL